MEWSELELDPCGFITIAELQAVVAARGEGALRALVGSTLALVACYPPDDRAGSASGLTKVHALEDPDDESPQAGTVVAFVAKRPGSPFAAMVTIGRTLECDLRILYPTISKIHAFFLQDGPRWLLVDQRSTNHSFVNEVELAAGQRISVRAGDRLRFGPRHAFRLRDVDGLLQDLACVSRSAA